MGIQIIQCVAKAEIQAYGGGYCDEHHGGEDADVGKPHGVLLHTVKHTGYSRKVLGLIIKSAIGAQTFQNGNGTGGKQTECADDNQKHCHEKQQHGGNGIFYGQGNPIAAQERHKTERCQDPFGAGLFFTGVVAVQKFNGL